MQLKKYCLSLFLTFSTCYMYSQNVVQPLTKKQKVDDFNYLFDNLSDSYPYFEVNKRLTGIDWLHNKKMYLNKIKNSKSDVAFFNQINTILNDLNNGHTDTYPTKIYSYFYDAYIAALVENPNLKGYISELDKTTPEKCEYWREIASTQDSRTSLKGETQNVSTEEVIPQKNISTHFFNKENFATVKITSFSYDLIDSDIEILQAFFKKARSYNSLIIDIRGNQGGDDTYWMKYIVPYLIGNDIEYPIITAFKASEKMTQMKPDYKANIPLETLNFKNLPVELLSGDYKFMKHTNMIQADSATPNYKGAIYLLVDRKVYSSAESFTYFCKATRFATVVGEQTAGDGIGSDPLLLTLPNSGIVIRFTGEMALNVDGSSNEEMKTIPDIEINNLTIQTTMKEIISHISSVLANNKK